MKKTFRSAIAVLTVAATALCVSSCGKQKPSAADTADVDEMVGMVMAAEDSASMAEATSTIHLADYDAAFFEGNSGYKTTPSGLKYVTVVPGTGVSPKATDVVTVHYTGRLLDGKVFDSSIPRGEPSSFPLQAVIKGWTEGLQLMKTGGKSVFYIPSELAYGEMGTPGGPIPPNSDLIFEVQLINVESQQ